MRLGVFPAMAGRQAGGPETYECRLVAEMAGLLRDDELHVFCLSEPAARAFPAGHPGVSVHVLRPALRVVSMTASLPLAMLRTGVDLLHATFAPPPLSPRPFVFTNHCLSSFTHPEFYDDAIRLRLNALIRAGLRGARRIICVSRSTLETTAELFRVPTERMTVVANGVADRFAPMPPDEARARIAARYGIRAPYLLFIGKVETRKNVVRILEAFDRFRHEVRDDVKLVLAGRRTPTSVGIDETIARLGLRDLVVEPGYVDDDDLPALYGAAELFVFPSLWEGFGIPVIEAMACGTPVVTSNLSALPEVAGDAALLVDPYRVEDIAAAMHRAYTDGSLRADLRERGFRRARMFSWKRTAQETLDAYHDAHAA